MGLSFVQGSVLTITIIFGILVVLIILQSILKKRKAWAFLISLIFGLSAGLSAIFRVILFSGNNVAQSFFQSLHLNLYGFHFFFFYIFFERLISRRPNSLRFAIMVGLLLTQTIGLWLVFYNSVNGLNTDMPWFLSDIGYWTPALFVYLGMGVPIFLRTYLYTKEKTPLVLSIALLFVGIGFIFSFFNDLPFLFGVFDIELPTSDIITQISEVANIFPLIGIILFMLPYIINIDYLYRLPNDTYILMVLRQDGTPVHTVKFKTRTKVKIPEFLLSGMISAINGVFKELFKKEASIRTISSEGVHILIEPKENILALIITDNVSFFLQQGLKRYVKIFEDEFGHKLKEGESNIFAYNKAINLLKSIFPYFIVEKEEISE